MNLEHLPPSPPHHAFEGYPPTHWSNCRAVFSPSSPHLPPHCRRRISPHIFSRIVPSSTLSGSITHHLKYSLVQSATFIVSPFYLFSSPTLSHVILSISIYFRKPFLPPPAPSSFALTSFLPFLSHIFAIKLYHRALSLSVVADFIA